MFDGPIKGALFTAWVEQSLVPILKPRDVVVLDTEGSHKGHRARHPVRAAGAHLLFLPPYTLSLQRHTASLCGASCRLRSDLNPIEMLFAKLKSLFRKADRRTIEAAWREVGSLLDRFSPAECAAYLRHAGYGAIAA